MNLSALFIRRPVATTLIQLAIVIFGIIGYRALPVSDLPTVDFPTIQVNASLPGANPETMAAAVATPLEKQFSTIAGVTSDQLDAAAWAARRSRCSSSSIATSTPPRRTCRRRSRARRASCRRTCRRRRRSRRSIPPTQPILFLALSSPTLPLSQVERVRRDDDRRSASRWSSGVAQVQVFGAQKFAVRVDLDPRAARRARHRHRRGGRRAIQRGNVNRPTGTLYGRDRTFTVKTERPADRRRGVPAARSSPTATAGRCGSTRSRTSTTASRTTRRRAGSTTRARSTSRSSGSRARTPSRSSTRSRRCCRSCRRSCRRRSSSASAATGRSRFASRCTTSSSRCVLTVVLVVLVIFLFLRNVSATIIPEPRAAGVDRRHVRGDVPARLQPRQPVADGADARRSASSSTTRSSCSRTSCATWSIGESADGGRAERLAGNRVHDRLDDAVARRGLHSRAVHGRHRRPAAARVRGDDRRRDSGVRLRVDQPDADAVRALAPRPARTCGTAGVYMAIERVLRMEPRRRTAGRCARRCSTTAVTMVVSVAAASARRSICFRIIPKGFIPTSGHRPASAATTEVAQGIGFDAMVAHQKQVADIVQADPNVLIVHLERRHGRRRRQQPAGGCSIDLKPRDERKLTADEVIDELRPKVAAFPGVRVFLQNPPAIRIGGRQDAQRCTSSRCRAATPTSSTTYGAEARSGAARDARAWWTSRATCSWPIRRSTSRSIATGSPRSGLTADQVEAALASAYRHESGVDDLRAEQRVPGASCASRRSTRIDPTALSLLYVKIRQRRAGAALERSRASSRASARSRSTTPGSCRR